MSKLYTHENHPHQPQSVTLSDTHEHMKARGGLNAAIAVILTRGVGSMWAAYVFVVLAFVGLFGVIGLLAPEAYTLVAWTSQTLIQLVMLPVIMVGQAILGKHAEMISEETAKTTLKSYHQLGQIVKHLNAQDDELLRIVATSSEVKEVRIVQMQHESMLVSLKSDMDALSRAVEMVDRRLQQLQKKASA